MGTGDCLTKTASLADTAWDTGDRLPPVTLNRVQGDGWDKAARRDDAEGPRITGAGIRAVCRKSATLILRLP